MVDVIEGIGWDMILELIVLRIDEVVMTDGEDEHEGDRTKAAIGLKLRWK